MSLATENARTKLDRVVALRSAARHVLGGVAE